MTELSLAKRVIELERRLSRGTSRCCNQKTAAEYMQRSREYVRRLVVSGRLKKNSLGQYDFSALDKLMDEGK